MIDWMDGCSSVVDCLVCVSEFDGQHKKKKEERQERGKEKRKNNKKKKLPLKLSVD